MIEQKKIESSIEFKSSTETEINDGFKFILANEKELLIDKNLIIVKNGSLKHTYDNILHKESFTKIYDRFKECAKKQKTPDVHLCMSTVRFADGETKTVVELSINEKHVEDGFCLIGSKNITHNDNTNSTIDYIVNEMSPTIINQTEHKKMSLGDRAQWLVTRAMIGDICNP